MYAIIESCGKQYKVEEKDIVFFEKLETEVGKTVKFENVILVSDQGKVQIGNPYVKGVKVEGKVVSHGKGKKIIVYKMKPKKNYRRKQGHRQPYTKVEITTISLGGNKKEETPKVVEKKVEVKKETTPKVAPKKEETKKEVAPKAETKKETAKA